MTEEQAMKANELIVAKAEINSFLKMEYNKTGSMATWKDADDEKNRKMARSGLVSVTLMNSKSYSPDLEDDIGELWTAYLPRDVVDRALREELHRIYDQLKELVVDPVIKTGNTAAASDTQ